jgi:hypothetical protein
MGICELASELSRKIPTRVKTVGGIAATAFLSFFLSNMPATYASAQPNDGDRSGDQQEDGDIEFYKLFKDDIYVTTPSTYYINVPGNETSVRIIPQALKRTLKIRAKHNVDVQPWLKVYQNDEQTDYIEMDRIEIIRQGLGALSEHDSSKATSTARVSVTLPDNYIKLEAVDPESGEVMGGVVPSNEGEVVVDLAPQEGINLELTHQDGNNFAEFEIPGGYEFFTVYITQDGETQEINYVGNQLRSSLNSNEEFHGIGGRKILADFEPEQLSKRSVLGVDDRARDYKAMATEVLRNFFQEHGDVAKYLAQRGLEYREGYFPEHITGGTSSSPFLTKIDFRTRTARIYEAGNSNVTQDPQLTFKVEVQRNRTRAFHKGVAVDSYVTSDRMALNSLLTALDKVVTDYDAAQSLTDRRLGGKRKVLVVADAATVEGDAYQYLVNKLYFGDANHLQFSLIDPNSEDGQKSLARYKRATDEQFQEGSVLFEYMQIDTGEKEYMEFSSDYIVRPIFTDSDLLPITNFILRQGPSKQDDYIQRGRVQQPVE